VPLQIAFQNVLLIRMSALEPNGIDNIILSV
jgi:hypothetical protein